MKVERYTVENQANLFAVQSLHDLNFARITTHYFVILGTLVSFTKRLNLVDPKPENLFPHLMKFFRYYSHFSFDRSIISPLHGQIYDKADW